MELPELKDGMIIKCIASHDCDWWTEGKEYLVVDGCITADDGDDNYISDCTVGMDFEVLYEPNSCTEHCTNYELGKEYICTILSSNDDKVIYRGTNKQGNHILEEESGNVLLVHADTILKPVLILQEELVNDLECVCEDINLWLEDGDSEEIVNRLIKLGWVKGE